MDSVSTLARHIVTVRQSESERTNERVTRLSLYECWFLPYIGGGTDMTMHIKYIYTLHQFEYQRAIAYDLLAH